MGSGLLSSLLVLQRGQTPVLSDSVLISLLTALRAFERQHWVKTKFTDKVLQVKECVGKTQVAQEGQFLMSH